MRRFIYNNKHRILKLYYQGTPPSVLMHEYRIPSSTLYSWIAKTPKSVVMVSNSNHEIINYYRNKSHCEKIEKELAFLRRTLVKDTPRNAKIAIIDREYGKESLHVQCEALDINRSTYLNHKNRSKKEDIWFKKREAEYSKIIQEIYEESGHVYGARKIAAIIRSKGKAVSDKYVGKLMSELGLISNRSSSDKSYRLIARHLREANHSAQDFKPNRVNQVWVSDTTAVLVHHRYYYICVFLDLFSRKVVSWAIGRNNSTRLTKRTFLAAYANRKPSNALIIHTDNGSCYVSYGFEQALSKYNISHSCSRTHIPHDNAVAESFFSTLKREGIFLNGYPKSLRELKEHVSASIDRYNSTRPHEHLGYLSPNEFERQKRS